MVVRDQKGFTLLEVLVVVAIVTVLGALAIPSFSEWQKNAQFKEGARLLASAFRQARNTAITRNLETRVVVDVPERKFHIEVGDRTNNSVNWEPLKGGETEFSRAVTLKTTTSCNGNSATSAQFNPDGTSNTPTICIMDRTTQKYRVRIMTATSGRVVIEKM